MESPSARAAPIQLRRLSGHDGLRLVADQHGEDEPQLLYAHGFGQSRGAWREAGATLAARGYGGLAIDARGHGDSAWLESGEYELDHFVADLRCVAAQFARPPVLVGASMGGLVGLLAEGETAPGNYFSGLVLVDVTPRWERAGVDRILAFMAAHPEGFSSLEAAQAAVTAYLPHREGKDPERLRNQLRRGEDGRWRWHWDPRLLGPVANAAELYIPRLQAAAGRIELPTLLLSGALSDVVSDHTIAEFRRLVPHAEHVVVQRATHLVVGDRNDVFSAEILAWLERVAPGRAGRPQPHSPSPGAGNGATSTGV